LQVRHGTLKKRKGSEPRKEVTGTSRRKRREDDLRGSIRTRKNNISKKQEEKTAFRGTTLDMRSSRNSSDAKVKRKGIG